MSPLSDRNRLMFAAFQTGRTMEEIAKDHTLTQMRVRAVLTDEKHKRVVSLEPFYRALRGT